MNSTDPAASNNTVDRDSALMLEDMPEMLHEWQTYNAIARAAWKNTTLDLRFLEISELSWLRPDAHKGYDHKKKTWDCSHYLHFVPDTWNRVLAALVGTPTVMATPTVAAAPQAGAGGAAAAAAATPLAAAPPPALAADAGRAAGLGFQGPQSSSVEGPLSSQLREGALDDEEFVLARAKLLGK